MIGSLLGPELCVLRTLLHGADNCVLSHCFFVCPWVAFRIEGDFKGNFVRGLNIRIEVVLNAEVLDARVLVERRVRSDLPLDASIIVQSRRIFFRLCPRTNIN